MDNYTTYKIIFENLYSRHTHSSADLTNWYIDIMS